MNKYLTAVVFALCIGLSAFASWHHVVSMPGYGVTMAQPGAAN